MKTYKAISVADLVVAVGEAATFTSWGLGGVSGEVGLIATVGGSLYIYLRGGTVVRARMKRDGTGLLDPTVGSSERRWR